MRGLTSIETLFLSLILISIASLNSRGQSVPLNTPGLTGIVQTLKKSRLEGVLVSARKSDSDVTVTVVSNAQGRYTFPAAKISPGQYSLAVRAAGYELDSPVSINVQAYSRTTANLKLRPTKDLSSQLSSTEWLNSFPGTHEEKSFLLNCVLCHTLERIAKSRHTPEEWLAVFDRMANYNAVDSTRRPQKGIGGSAARFGNAERLQKQAEYMRTINLSRNDRWDYKLSDFGLPAGRSTHVIITEYDLPRKDALPHDVEVDSKGTVWYADAGYNYLASLDPHTDKVTEYPVPILRADHPLGLLDIEFDRKKQNLWIAPWLQANRFISFEPETAKFKTWDIPKGIGDRDIPRLAFLMPFRHDIDGKVWGTDAGGKIFRLDSSTGKVDTLSVFDSLSAEASPEGHSMSSDQQGHAVYQVTADSQNNCYFMDTAGDIGRVDAKTLAVTFFPTPTPNSYPRRGHMDPQDALWFGEYRGDRIGYFDTKQNRFREWLAPHHWTATYEAAPAPTGEVWAAGVTSDRIQRLDPKTGKTIEYLLPRYTDARRIVFDDSGKQLKVWIPNKNAASLIEIEPLD